MLQPSKLNQLSDVQDLLPKSLHLELPPKPLFLDQESKYQLPPKLLLEGPEYKLKSLLKELPLKMHYVDPD